MRGDLKWHVSTGDRNDLSRNPKPNAQGGHQHQNQQRLGSNSAARVVVEPRSHYTTVLRRLSSNTANWTGLDWTGSSSRSLISFASRYHIHLYLSYPRGCWWLAFVASDICVSANPTFTCLCRPRWPMKKRCHGSRGKDDAKEKG